MATLVETISENAPAARNPLRALGYLFALLAAVLVLIYLPVWAFASQADFLTVWLTHEDGPYEAGGAICCLAAALLFGYVGLSHSPTASRNYFALLLAAGSLLMFLEEISWGQRIFSLTVPQWLKDANIQEEWTIHNLRIFHPTLEDNRLKRFWLNGSVVFLGVIPLVAALCPPLRRASARWQIPLARWQLALAVLLAYACYLYSIVRSVAARDLYAAHDIGEATELVIEAAYLLLAIELFLAARDVQTERSFRPLGILLAAVLIPFSLLMTWGLMRTGLTRDPHLQAVSCFRRANVLAAESQPKAAIASLDRALRLWPERIDFRSRLAILALQQKDLVTGADQYRQILRIDPQNVDAHIGLGVSLHGLGHVSQAIQEFETAARLDPQNADAQNNLGVIYARQARWADAVNCFAEAVRLRADPQFQKNLEDAQRALAGQPAANK